MTEQPNIIEIDREYSRQLRRAQRGEITWEELNSHGMSAIRQAFPTYYASEEHDRA